MSKNRGVVYLGPNKVEVQDIEDPKFQAPDGRSIDHGVILKVLSTNICGSDQHMVRGRTTAPAGLVLGHEITGEVIERGKGVEQLQVRVDAAALGGDHLIGGDGDRPDLLLGAGILADLVGGQ